MPKWADSSSKFNIHRIKNLQVRMTVSALLEPLKSLGYTNIKSVSLNNLHQVLTLNLEGDMCMQCNNETKFIFTMPSGQLEKTCGSYSCPAHIYTASKDDTTDSYTITEVGWVDERKQSGAKIVGSIQNTKAYRTNAMIEAAVTCGIKLAKVLHLMQRNYDDYPTDVFDGKYWWFYDAQKFIWVLDKSGTHIHQTIVESIQRDYGHLKSVVESDRQMIVASIDTLLEKLNTRKFRDCLVKDCTITFLDREFVSRLNTKPNLVACSNGVYDLDVGQLRAGKPSDYLTFSTHRKFDPNYDFAECAQFIRDVLVDEDVITMLMDAFCSSLHGNTQLHKFFMWVGCGSNGKSKLASLLRLALGDLSITIPVTVFTQKRIEYGKACPELQRTKGRRLVFISEPSHNETLNLGIVKEVTGGDSMFTRGLYEEGGEIQYAPSPLFCCE